MNTLEYKLEQKIEAFIDHIREPSSTAIFEQRYQELSEWLENNIEVTTKLEQMLYRCGAMPERMSWSSSLLSALSFLDQEGNLYLYNQPEPVIFIPQSLTKENEVLVLPSSLRRKYYYDVILSEAEVLCLSCMVGLLPMLGAYLGADEQEELESLFWSGQGTGNLEDLTPFFSRVGEHIDILNPLDWVSATSIWRNGIEYLGDYPEYDAHIQNKETVLEMWSYAIGVYEHTYLEYCDA